MTFHEYLLIQLMSECNEVAHRASKMLHFGINEKQEGQDKTNAERLEEELLDLTATIQMLRESKILDYVHDIRTAPKINKIKKYMEYSRTLGILDME